MVFIPTKEARLSPPVDFSQFYEQLETTLAQQTQPCHWLSLTLPLPPLDPLMALQQIGGLRSQHFYWEQPSAEIAVAAAFPSLSIQFEGPERFTQAQAWIKRRLAETAIAGDLSLPFSGPHFFCSFTFFDQVAAIAPFPPAQLLLPQWQVACGPQREGGLRQGSFVTNLALHHQRLDPVACRWVWQQYQTLRQPHPRDRLAARAPHRPAVLAAAPTQTDLDGAPFLASVESALGAIAQGQLHKVVLAHTLRVQAARPLSIAAALATLRQRHPDCYTFSVGSGLGPVFLGASPERLLRVHQRQLQTEAIAGSAPRGENAQADRAIAEALRNSPKELHEHQLVSTFIVKTLQQLGLDPQHPLLPRVLSLTGIQHLQTPIQCRLPAHIHPLDVLARLHPTPAVAGVPQQVACEQIQQWEGFERSLYAAPLGWIDRQSNCDFCVGIRSALIEGRQAQLFAGAGIVSGSQPEQELAEIVLKLRTLLAVLTGEGPPPYPRQPSTQT